MAWLLGCDGRAGPGQPRKARPVWFGSNRGQSYFVDSDSWQIAVGLIGDVCTLIGLRPYVGPTYVLGDRPMSAIKTRSCQSNGKPSTKKRAKKVLWGDPTKRATENTDSGPGHHRLESETSFPATQEGLRERRRLLRTATPSDLKAKRLASAKSQTIGARWKGSQESTTPQSFASTDARTSAGVN